MWSFTIFDIFSSVQNVYFGNVILVPWYIKMSLSFDSLLFLENKH